MRHRLFFLLYAVTAVGLITPLFRFAWRPEPLLFGLPPAIVWVIALLLVMFLAVLALFVTERPEGGGTD